MLAHAKHVAKDSEQKQTTPSFVSHFLIFTIIWSNKIEKKNTDATEFNLNFVRFLVFNAIN